MNPVGNDPLVDVRTQLDDIEIQVDDVNNDLNNLQIDHIRRTLRDLNRQLDNYARQNQNDVNPNPLRNRIEAVEARLNRREEEGVEREPMDFNRREEEDELEPMDFDVEMNPRKRVREADEGEDIGEGDRKRPRIDDDF